MATDALGGNSRTAVPWSGILSPEKQLETHMATGPGGWQQPIGYARLREFFPEKKSGVFIL